MPARLQDGIFAGPGLRPGAAFGILFLRAEREQNSAGLHAILAELTTMLAELAAGRVGDLPGHPVPAGGLSVLLGFGPKAFAVPGAKRALPAELGASFQFRSPLPAGGGPLVRNAGLGYAEDITRNLATEELCLQFIADTHLAVSRATVETWKLLRDRRDPSTGAAPLEIVAVFEGFQRDDRRSWIDFHDGVSNLRSADRHKVVVIDMTGDPADAWTVGGSYLAFLRIAVDLDGWRSLRREQQELLVGRDKLTGSPLTGTDGQGRPVPDPGCPVAGTSEVVQPGNDSFHEPSQVGEPAVALSHVQRANHNKAAPPEQPNSLRVFRQGYEFFESSLNAPGFRVGLNFVSFQDTPDRLLRMLTKNGWLGQVNFGGDPGEQPPAVRSMLTVRAGGVYLVPPVVDGEAYPGASIFT